MLMSAHPDNKGDTFSVTPDGRKVDEHIHGPILDNEEAESGLDDEFLRRLEERGYSKEHIDAERKLIEEKRKRPKQARGGKVRTYTMPLKKGKSQATISSNIREFHTGPTYAATKAKFGKAKADEQAIAAAMSQARRSKQGGGRIIAPQPFDPHKLGRWANPIEQMEAGTGEKGSDFGTGQLQNFRTMQEANDVVNKGIDKQRMLFKSMGDIADAPGAVKIPEITYGGDLGIGKRNRGGPIDSALSQAKMQFGGRMGEENFVMRNAARNLHFEGMIHSSVPGRTDKLPMNVPAGAYVLPADTASALGQGNSKAGGNILSKMFSSGPYGVAPLHSAARVSPPRLSGLGPPRSSGPRLPAAPKMAGIGQQKPPRLGMFAEGGVKDGQGETVPIIAAGGEFIVHPDVVRDIGHGSLSAGHKVLDKFVLKVRAEYKKTLGTLKPPKGSHEK